MLTRTQLIVGAAVVVVLTVALTLAINVFTANRDARQLEAEWRLEQQQLYEQEQEEVAKLIADYEALCPELGPPWYDIPDFSIEYQKLLWEICLEGLEDLRQMQR